MTKQEVIAQQNKDMKKLKEDYAKIIKQLRKLEKYCDKTEAKLKKMTDILNVKENAPLDTIILAMEEPYDEIIDLKADLDTKKISNKKLSERVGQLKCDIVAERERSKKYHSQSTKKEFCIVRLNEMIRELNEC